jgi:predicted TIM-barrel enzyme
MLSSVAQFSVELKTIRGHGDKHHIFAPALALFPSALARDITTFPLCNTNQITMEYLKSTRDCAPKSYYCAVFALDPFIDWEEFSALLHAAEFHGICNFPTIPDFDEVETNALAASDYSYEMELQRIKGFAGDKFEMLILYSSRYQLELYNRIIGKGKAHHCQVDRIADFSSCYDNKQC